jgi:hypothetical protein
MKVVIKSLTVSGDIVLEGEQHPVRPREVAELIETLIAHAKDGEAPARCGCGKCASAADGETDLPPFPFEAREGTVTGVVSNEELHAALDAAIDAGGSVAIDAGAPFDFEAEKDAAARAVMSKDYDHEI